MRSQLLFSVFVGIAVSGCGQCEYSCVPQNTADLESPDDEVWHEVPYHLVETKADGSHVIQYVVEVMHSESQITTDANGQEEIHTVMVPFHEERLATVAPGEDISEFLSGYADGKIVNRGPNARFDDHVEAAPAPAPPAPSES